MVLTKLFFSKCSGKIRIEAIKHDAVGNTRRYAEATCLHQKQRTVKTAHGFVFCKRFFMGQTKTKSKGNYLCLSRNPSCPVYSNNAKLTTQKKSESIQVTDSPRGNNCCLFWNAQHLEKGNEGFQLTTRGSFCTSLYALELRNTSLSFSFVFLSLLMRKLCLRCAAYSSSQVNLRDWHKSTGKQHQQTHLVADIARKADSETGLIKYRRLLRNKLRFQPQQLSVSGCVWRLSTATDASMVMIGNH